MESGESQVLKALQELQPLLPSVPRSKFEAVIRICEQQTNVCV